VAVDETACGQASASERGARRCRRCLQQGGRYLQLLGTFRSLQAVSLLRRWQDRFAVPRQTKQQPHFPFIFDTAPTRKIKKKKHPTQLFSKLEQRSWAKKMNILLEKQVCLGTRYSRLGTRGLRRRIPSWLCLPAAAPHSRNRADPEVHLGPRLFREAPGGCSPFPEFPSGLLCGVNPHFCLPRLLRDQPHRPAAASQPHALQN